MMIFFGVILILCAVYALLVPNWLVNTASCKRNWVIICLILTGGGLVIESTDISLFFSSILFIGICINYAVPMLLNMWESFNRKSDP